MEKRNTSGKNQGNIGTFFNKKCVWTLTITANVENDDGYNDNADK